ncbi:Protein CHUP1, chloroplastic [Apostasia shenzhenica]|uniref:Protein CHUP1, chloroplastic n=1 Tax=Apostasia shenzhenica TaxID=1088818 RepID=A0A2I0AP55_9ASPA|nr:Protein CHUP1, chloroplastic [Apostasia shenzhenica]
MNRRREVKPFLWRAGFALVLSLFFATRHRRRPNPPPIRSLSDAAPSARATSGEIDDEVRSNQTKDGASAKIIPRAHVTFEEDRFEEEKNSPETIPTSPLTEEFKMRDVTTMEEEVRYLRNLVQSLQSRERCLEVQLLEYHGLKEQEISMGELQNRLKLSAVETRLLMLKIQSLKAENEKLRAETSDFSRFASELEIEKRNTKLLKSKLKAVGEQAKEKIAALHLRITELREKERNDLEHAVEIEKKMKRFDELDNEVMELTKQNLRLVREKLELETKLKSEQILGHNSVMKRSETLSFDERNLLREENDKLKNAIEQLRTDRCADVEELVYLRWVNACLRYELRNCQPPPGRTLARDLSRCLSPNSEVKLKQLILEYSNSGFVLDCAGLMEYDLDSCSSQDSQESDETSLGSSKAKSSKSGRLKFLSKLKKLVLGKEMDGNKKSGTCEGRATASTCTFEEMASCLSAEQVEGDDSAEIRPNCPSRCSLDVESLRGFKLEEAKGGLTERCKSDLGAIYSQKRMNSCEQNLIGSTCSLADIEVGEAEKMKLKKFAEVFKGSKGHMKVKRRAASFSFA